MFKWESLSLRRKVGLKFWRKRLLKLHGSHNSLLLWSIIFPKAYYFDSKSCRIHVLLLVAMIRMQWKVVVLKVCREEGQIPFCTLSKVFFVPWSIAQVIKLLLPIYSLIVCFLNGCSRNMNRSENSWIRTMKGLPRSQLIECFSNFLFLRRTHDDLPAGCHSRRCISHYSEFCCLL